MPFRKTDRARRRATEFLRGSSIMKLQEKLTGRTGKVGSGEFGTGIEPYGPLQKTPSSDHPYFKGGDSWSNIPHGRTYYITEKGLDYFHGSFEQYPKDNQHAIWTQTLFDNAPQTKAAFVDQTNDLFNSGVTLQDHHTAEYLAAELYKRGYLTFNADEAAEY